MKILLLTQQLIAINVEQVVTNALVIIAEQLNGVSLLQYKNVLIFRFTQKIMFFYLGHSF